MSRQLVEVADLKEGDLIIEAEELGPVRHIREVSVNYGSALTPGVGYRVYGEHGNDLFGSPQRVEVERPD